MLVWQTEGGAEDSAIHGLRDRVQGEAVEGREHTKFELEGIGCRESEGDELIVFVFGEFDCISLKDVSGEW